MFHMVRLSKLVTIYPSVDQPAQGIGKGLNTALTAFSPFISMMEVNSPSTILFFCPGKGIDHEMFVQVVGFDGNLIDILFIRDYCKNLKVSI